MFGAHMWARVLCFFGIIGLLAALPASAQSNSPLPTSEVPSFNPWLKMNPSTFQVSPEAVLEQFDRVAITDPRLTSVQRAKLAAMLKAGEGVVVMVPDGIVLDYLTGRRAGKPSTYRGMKKALGREDRALLFKLDDNVSVYWFTGDKGKSCNNIGVVFKTPPTSEKRDDPPKEEEEVVTMTAIPSYLVGGQPIIVPGFVSQGCCCMPFFTPGYVIQSGSNQLQQQSAFVRGYKPN